MARVLNRLTLRLTQWATRRNVLMLIALDLVMNAALLPLASARLANLTGGVGPLDTALPILRARPIQP